MAKRTISIETVCQIILQPRNLYILIKENNGGYSYCIYHGNSLLHRFILSSCPFSEREIAVRKLALILRVMRHRFNDYRRSKKVRKNKFKGKILTEYHIDEIEKCLREGNDSVQTSAILL
jgi:hypothetical protein